MANNFTSNTVEQLISKFIESYESNLVLTKTVDTQTLTPNLTPKSGGTVSVKRPTDYVAIETADGDLNGKTESDMIVGKATGVVQNMITTWVKWDQVEEALEMDQMDELVAPMARRIVTQLETNLGRYMFKNCGLKYGTPGTAVSAWSDVAGAAAFMDSIGVPQDMAWNYVMNPFSQLALADAQNGLANGSDSLVDEAWKKAMISRDFGGMRALKSNALSTYTTGTVSDRAGVVASNPDVTYVTAKDTMTQSIAVSGFGAGADTIKAGEIVEITGRFRNNLSTKDAVLDSAGNQIKWTGTVTADVTLSGGAGTLVVTGPAIYEATGGFNTTDSAVVSGDVITLLNSASTVTQPNLFYHQKAFGIGFVKLPKIFDKDTIVTNKDGFALRMTRYGDGTRGIQRVRFDMLPAFITFNPFWAGQGYGV